MIVLAFDAEGAVIEANDAARALLRAVEAEGTFATLFPTIPMRSHA